MKALKVILIIIGILVAAVLIIPLFSPATVRVSSDIDIELLAEQVFPGVASFENRDKWDPWLTMDSTAVADIKSMEGYVGSAYAWEGERLGKGRMRVDSVVENKYIASSLWFGEVETPSQVEWTFENVNGITHVVWSFSEKTSYPIGRLRMMIGKVFLKQSFDIGLANLKEYIEANPPALTGMSEIIIDTFDPVYTMVTESPGRMDAEVNILQDLFPKVMAEVSRQGLTPAGPPFALYSEWDEQAGTFIVMAGIVVDATGEKAGDVFPKYFEAWKGAVGKHTGPYTEMEPSYMKLQQYIEAHNLETTGEAIEIYLNDPVRVSDPNKLETLIAFPLK